MAKKEKPQEAEAEVEKGGKKKLILIILIALLVLGGAGGAAYFFLMGGDEEEVAAEEAASSEGQGEQDNADEKASDDRADSQAPLEPLIYHELDPVTVNITTPGPVRFLRLKPVVVTRDPAVVAAVDKHLPRFRNDLLARLASIDVKAANTFEGKQALREQMRTMLEEILSEAREPDDVTDILFTDFVMQ